MLALTVFPILAYRSLVFRENTSVVNNSKKEKSKFVAAAGILTGR